MGGQQGTANGPRVAVSFFSPGRDLALTNHAFPRSVQPIEPSASLRPLDTRPVAHATPRPDPRTWVVGGSARRTRVSAGSGGVPPDPMGRSVRPRRAAPRATDATQPAPAQARSTRSGKAPGSARPGKSQRRAAAKRPASKKPAAAGRGTGRGRAGAGDAQTRARPASQPPPPRRRFLVGPALSVWQNSGDAPGDRVSNWGRWSHPGASAWGGLRPSILHGDSPVAGSCGWWDRFEEDIALAASLGSNAIRLSLEWARCFPKDAKHPDLTAVARFHSMLDACAAAGLTPLLTLHHFVHPAWFDAPPYHAFETDTGAAAFVDWAVWAVREFGRHTASWCTFNEPGVYVSSGYASGVFPPGKFMALRTGGRVLHRMLRAHGAAYAAIKAMHAKEGERLGLLTPEIGIVHNLMPYEAKRPGTPDGAPGTGWALTLPSTRLLPPSLRGARFPLVPPWSAALAALGHNLWGNEAVLDYLRSGVFAWRPVGEWMGSLLGRGALGAALTPGFVADDGRPPPLDWIGLNFYGRVVLDGLCRPCAYPSELVTDFQQGVWADGFRHALRAVGGLGVPVFVMETGLPDAADGVRAAWADAYLGVVEEAVVSGQVDVRGCASACFDFFIFYGERGGEWNGMGRERVERAPLSSPHRTPPHPTPHKHTSLDARRQFRVGVRLRPALRPVRVGLDDGAGGPALAAERRGHRRVLVQAPARLGGAGVGGVGHCRG
jgi:beta-glucosidase